MKILMVRSPLVAINKGYIGYGRARVNFSTYQSVTDIVQAINEKYENGIGRNTNNISRFFNLQKGDVVVVPLSKAITIGIVEGEKSFDLNLAKDKACNLIAVNFFRTVDGHILRIPRKDLSQGLESRLKSRTTISNLNIYKDEIHRIIDSIESQGAYKQDTYLLEQIAESEINFKNNLLSAITSGKTWLSAGGNGLEHLVKELLEAEGYNAKIQAKNQSSDIADVDIVAQKIDRFSESYLEVQVKHHHHISGKHGLEQLIAYETHDSENEHLKLFITTANLSESNKEYATANNIRYMTGDELVDWIYDQLPKLSFKTKQLLGIIEIPTVVKS
ncbi:restriction endonuclease [Acinetobacter populi]|uniref:Restriction endonuclease n=1 Tax=Acinetobacter populi TaxID=1582270 RepID=A0A1Z9YZY7_9GAMM|nr:restriction endonuclease [Acinetobacter populi]OUY07776.1 restriction endonuclease [Acinetobacter populi]